MADKNKSGRVTIANFIALIGLVLLMVFSFLGLYYKSGGEIGWAIAIAAGITLCTLFLLWLLIKAKGAENDLAKWKTIEIATLVAFIFFAIPVAVWGGVMHFFVVNSQKEEIKALAHNDLDEIANMFEQYKEFEAQAISRTGAGLRNATGPGQRCDAVLNRFMEENHISHTRESARNFETIQQNLLLGIGFENMYNAFKAERADIENVVDSWSVMLIPSKAKMIEELEVSARKNLTDLSAKGKLPVVTYDSASHSYTLGELQTWTYSGTDETAEITSSFRHAIRDAEGFSFTAVLVVIMIEVMILFNYIVAYRTRSRGVIGKAGDDDGGISLDKVSKS